MTRQKTKIGFIGIGNVGEDAVAALAQRYAADPSLQQAIGALEIVMHSRNLQSLWVACQDIKDGFGDAYPAGLVLRHTQHWDDWASLAGCDVIVNAVGVRREEGQPREGVLHKNLEVNIQIAKDLRALYANHTPPFLINIGNPVDVLNVVIQRETGFPPEKVVSLGSALDTARFQTQLADLFSVSPKDVEACIVGAHDDSMVPLLSQTRISGVPILQAMTKQNISQDRLDGIIATVKSLGGKQRDARGFGARKAPANLVTQMVIAFLTDQKFSTLAARMLPDGYWGATDPVAVGIPVLIDAHGANVRTDIQPTPAELEIFHTSAAKIRKAVNLSAL